ncbi:MAG: outer membrane beta-barrel protein [Candidatus Electrothrix sp. GW3-4]|uniref:outer membrane beta-barrel protein n=1 Tax=Candidatus Electrothrix sp. GW3-4 TaxID=3126740 RepID=UPI0030CDEDF8
MDSSRLFQSLTLLTVIFLLGLAFSGSAFAQADYEHQPSQHVFSVAGRFGIGGMVNSVNYGAGPSAEYWFTEHVGAMCTLGVTGDFKATTLRGQYLFNSLVLMSSVAMRPYLGIGYAHVEADRNHRGINFEAEEDGFEGYAGIMHNATWLHENLFVRGEIGLSAYDMALPDDDLSNFTVNIGVSLLF